MIRIFALMFLALIIEFGAISKSHTFQLSGGVETVTKLSSQVTESSNPVSGAQVSIPSYDFSTITTSNGKFEIPKNFSPPYVLTVKKAGYEPFSLTVTSLSKPLKIEISKNSPNKLVIEDNTYHLGDNSFSENSANAGDFRTKSMGTSYTKPFSIKPIRANQKVFLKIGSIIGLDTKEARRLGQNSISFAYSSPARVLLNSTPIAQLKINGDNQKIKLPNSLLLPNAKNTITIISGTNQQQSSYEDYDDFEFSNLIIEYN